MMACHQREDVPKLLPAEEGKTVLLAPTNLFG